MNFSKRNEMEKGAIKKEKKKYKKSPKTAQECKVCGRVTLFKYYKIQSCDACKQFFRRMIINRQLFTCTESNSCIITKEMKSCRACRLDKCLLEGMDPTMVEAEQSADLSQFIQTLYKRREFLQQKLKEKEEEICHMDTETVIENDENLTSVNVTNEEIVSMIQQLRAMPHFEMLEKTDQTILLNFVTIPLVLMNARFDSSKDNSKIDITINNKAISKLFHVAGDKILQLSDEEFFLVRALISSHSEAVFGLSDAGHRMLQHLSEHYANLLMHHLCTNCGNMAGAHRHAELIHLAKSVFSNAEGFPNIISKNFQNFLWRKFD